MAEKHFLFQPIIQWSKKVGKVEKGRVVQILSVIRVHERVSIAVQSDFSKG